MGEISWDVYFGITCVAKECGLEDALMIVEALAHKYLFELKELPACNIGIKLHINEDDKTEE